MTAEQRTESSRALERLMEVISQRTTIEPRNRPAIRASLRAYRRAIEREAATAEPRPDPDGPVHTDEEYVEYGVTQYRRGREQAEAEFAANPPVAPPALDVEKMARWIDQHYIGSVDHACHECLPGGPMVVPGFLCAPHTARLWLARLTAEEPER